VSKFVVFICATYADLSGEREAVMDAVRRLQLEHDAMEFFGARANRAIETCLEEVRRSNILVVIVGHRYGSLVPELDISFSEAEYNEGYRLNKPCLVYLRSDDMPVLPKHVEREPDKIRMLDRWRTTLLQRHTVAYFREASDLSLQVAADLGRTATTVERAIQSGPPQDVSAPFEEAKMLIERARQHGIDDRAILAALRQSFAAAIAEGGPRSVFLSYARADEGRVLAVAQAMRNLGIRVWLDQFDIVPGTVWPREIMHSLSTVDFIILFVSQNSARSRGVQKELEQAMLRRLHEGSGPVILPVLLESAEVPPLLRDIQWIDMRDGDIGKAVEALRKAIQVHAAIDLGRRYHQLKSTSF
jgi:hypothetical protein